MKYWDGTIKKTLLWAFLLCASAQFLLCPSCLGQQFSLSSRVKRQRISFELVKNLIIIPLYINEKGPFNFILDTGVGTFLITEPSLVDSLKLKNLSTIKVFGQGKDQEIEAFRTLDINLTLKRAQAKGVFTAILKKDIFNLSSYVGSKIYGIIGYTFFSSFDVKIDYVAKQLTFAVPGSSIKKNGEKLPISIEQLRPYLYASITPEGLTAQPVKLIVDCGASHALSMDLLHDKAFPLPKDTIRANLGVGLGGEISGRMGRMPTLRFGKFTFNDVISGFPAYDSTAQELSRVKKNGNMGAEILKRFDVIFDYTNSAMYLKKNRYFKNPFEHDMSGLELYGDPEGGKQMFIGRIEPDSPAEKAGLKPDDEILSINFRPITTISLDEVNILFKSNEGKTVVVEVYRDKQYLIKMMKLKRRI